MTNNKYSYETKLEAIRLLNEGRAEEAERHTLEIHRMEQELEVVKKYLIKEVLW